MISHQRPLSIIYDTLSLTNSTFFTTDTILLCNKNIHKLTNTLKLRKACGLDGIPNECLRHLPRRPLVHLTHLFNTTPLLQQSQHNKQQD
jgi:hypothetical protein